MTTNPAYRQCKWEKCPGTLPDWTIREDGMHDTCRKQKEKEEKKLIHTIESR